MRGPRSGYVLAVAGALAGTAAGVGVAAWLLSLVSDGESATNSAEDLLASFVAFVLTAWMSPFVVAAGCASGTFALLRAGGHAAPLRAALLTVAIGLPLALFVAGTPPAVAAAVVVAAIAGRHLSLPATDDGPSRAS